MIFLPIKPKYALQIHQLNKLVEFRKVGFKRNSDICIVYASSPVKKIIGYFVIEEVAMGTPNTIWRKYGRHGCISRAEFYEYFGSSEKAFAIKIKSYHALDQEVDPQERIRNFHIPQSFRYLSDSEQRHLMPELALA
ncbi:MAG TPA: hypothetical protein VHA78_05235 [Candidatus Peribacteraceae bacterium]|nr:hypothetical protein [Candidatus Peribacteraceae bacterium]